MKADVPRTDDGGWPRWWLVTRKYPPSVGGMERLSWEVTTRVARRRPAQIVAMRAAALGWPGFAAASALRVLAGCLRRRVALLHVGDPVLAPLAAIARAFGVPTVVTIHGLDVAYRHPMYRLYRMIFLRGFDAYVCISDAAREAAIAVGVPRQRIHVIGIGVEVPAPRDGRCARAEDRLLFVGRLVERKGLAWFVRDVLPVLASTRPSLRLSIVGEGPEHAAVVAAARAAGIEDRLIWHGAASDGVKANELACATLCIVPNVRVDGDIEGFGIVALEAAAAGCPVLAANIDGLAQAVVDGASGTLLPPQDARAWIQAIEDRLRDPAGCAREGEAARRYVSEHCTWDAVIDAYERLFHVVAGNGATRR